MQHFILVTAKKSELIHYFFLFQQTACKHNGKKCHVCIVILRNKQFILPSIVDLIAYISCTNKRYSSFLFNHLVSVVLLLFLFVYYRSREL